MTRKPAPRSNALSKSCSREDCIAAHVIRHEFLDLHCPVYWHYDALFGLRVLAEAGFVTDPRCQDALDYVRSRQMASGGWPADAAYWRISSRGGSGCSLVRWGKVGKTRVNEFVTVRAMGILRMAAHFAARHAQPEARADLSDP